jgi:diguanylate cyclase (GGDEF)-like protein
LLRTSEQLERLRRGALLDPLTGLLNRPGLAHVLELLVEQSRRHKGALSVLFLDLDGFKAANDAFGHVVGDRILCAVGDALQAQLRATDIAARWGGDEFVIVLPAAAPEMIVGVVARVEAAIAALSPVGVTLGVSIGVASLYKDVAAVDDAAHRLILRADEAMYRVKQSRRRLAG